jgi:hypothetical protein
MQASTVGPKAKLIRENARVVKELYPQVTNSQMLVLRELSRNLRLSVITQNLPRGWSPTVPPDILVMFKSQLEGQ